MEERKTIFAVKNTDRRKELIEAYNSEEFTFTGQKPQGTDVEMFTPTNGFILVNKRVPLPLSKAYMRRVKACAKLSLGPKLELREFYYTLRQHPELIEEFGDIAPESIYPTILGSINTMEVVCDVNRDIFTIGNLSKGFIYDRNSWSFNDPEKKVGFTENIAKDSMLDAQLSSTQNIIVVEKMSAANRLVEMGLSELTNSCIITTGGNFNRAIWYIAALFRKKKNIIYMCDADVYGDDMMRTIEFGTMNSSHLPYKFPPGSNPNIHLAGLWPSVAEELGLANDVEQKRPLNNPYAKQRLEFLERYNLIDQRDLDTWNRNKTYELEALSTAYVNDEQKPVGLGIYIIEYMRRKNLNIKAPLPPDDVLKEMFDNAAWAELIFEITEEVQSQSPKIELTNALNDILDKKEKQIIAEILSDNQDEYTEVLENVTAKEIKYHIYKQFETDPTRRDFDLRAIAHKLKKEFSIDVNMPAASIRQRIENSLNQYIKDLGDELWEANIIFEAIHNETVVDQNLYDLALAKIGAAPEDIEKVRNALAKRFEHA